MKTAFSRPRTKSKCELLSHLLSNVGEAPRAGQKSLSKEAPVRKALVFGTKSGGETGCCVRGGQREWIIYFSGKGGSFCNVPRDAALSPHPHPPREAKIPVVMEKQICTVLNPSPLPGDTLGVTSIQCKSEETGR